MRFSNWIAAAALLFALSLSGGAAFAIDLYWDINDEVPGASDSDTASGFWDTTTPNWSTTPEGDVLGQAWDTTAVAVFSAGTNATGISTITATGTSTNPLPIGGMVVEEGTIVINAGSLGLGTGQATVNAGAVLETNSSLRITASAGAKYLLNGGTLRTTNTGAAGSFIDVDAVIELGEAGGTVDYPVANVLNIIQTGTAISGTGSLTKTGVGVLAISAPATHTGGTFINDGELRIRTSSNRLPVTGTLTTTINSPGILNLNGVNQRLGIIAGDGRIGLANGTLTVQSSSTSTFNGTIEDTANAGAGGSTATGGQLTKAGTGTLNLNGANTYTGGTNLNNGRINLNNDSAAGSGDIRVTGTPDLGANSGTRNISNNIVLQNGATLQLVPSNTATVVAFRGTISETGGAGGLLRNNTGAGTMILSGDNTFTGGVQIVARGLVLGHNNALGTGTLTAGDAVNPPATPITLAAEVDLTSLGPVPNGVLLNQNMTVTGDNNFELAGEMSGPGGLIKSGNSTVTLSNAANSYAGDTAVSAGTLSLSNPFLANGADVQLSTGSLLNLNFSATDVIDSLFIDGVAQAIGTWGGTGSGADNTTPLITGSGWLQVSSLSEGIAGDHNGDGKVDAADYVHWRKNNSGNAQGYSDWRTNFGRTSGGGSGSLTSGAVPEPAAMWLLLLGASVGAVVRGRGRWGRGHHA